MIIFEAIFSLSIVAGYWAGVIIIISSCLKHIRIKNGLLNFIIKVIVIILILLILHIPSVFISAKTTCFNNNKLNFFDWMAIIWSAFIIITGWITIIKDWYFKWKSVSLKKQ
jgi:hypothetical protein